MRSITVGTAGHIDHGKSALVRALTGIDPDRLAEEQRRGMTLDLGFAHLTLPSGRRLGIVDVPGHEALIHNMLAGAGGIDLVMLVVAADEGAMPQTREHLDILRFLHLRSGVVVLNKTDLALEPEWVDAVREDLTRLVAGTPLEDAPVIAVSAKTGAGLPELVAALDRLSEQVPERPAAGPVRLPVDRSFVMQGFGTVVTGTLWSGTVRPGDLLTVLPEGRDVRVRGVQVHGETVSEAQAGSRVAANLSGIDKDEIVRGDVLATPGAFRPTDRLDVRLRLLPGAPRLAHSARLHLHLGAGEVIGRVALIDRGPLEPGDEGLAQLRLERPVVAVHGDRFIIRRYSPADTVGGGVVLNASPLRKARGARAGAALVSVDQGGPSALVVNAVAARGSAGLPSGDLSAAAGLDGPSAARAAAAGLAEGSLFKVGERLFAASVADALREAIVTALGAYHRQTPWREGMPREELKSRTSSAGDRLFDAVLASLRQDGRVVEARGLVAFSDHAVQITDGDARVRTALLDALERGGTSPPSVEDLRRLGDQAAVERMLQVLTDEGTITQIAPDLRITTAVLERARQMVVQMLRSGEDVTVGVVRDRLQTSRRHALA
ncbi:MAG TPA: selenocysteine-specific translation elongation factor, partial [bacterium]|nr:selenocysteine-specific translation elongation factor [bacterium]